MNAAANANVYLPQAGPAVPQQMGLTEKATEVLKRVNIANERAGHIEDRLIPPPPPPVIGTAEPEPDHILWILEAAMSRLAALNDRLERIGGAL